MPDAEIPRNDSDSESDSSDAEDDETQIHLQIQSLENDLSNNPYNYDAHVQYIRALRKQGELDKLWQAREAMNALFPLTPDMWQEWAKDEISLSSGEIYLSALCWMCSPTPPLQVAPRLEELQLFRLQEEIKSSAPSTVKGEISTEKNAHEKRKLIFSSADNQSPAKRRKDITQNLKISNKFHKGQAKESTEPGEVEAVGGQNSMLSRTNEKETRKRSHQKPKYYNDQCTVFIPNLSLQASDDDLRSFFSDVGGVVAIRILRDMFTKKSRGLAYVDFSDDSHLAAAVAKIKQTLLGKRLSIAKSDPQQRRNKGAASQKYQTGTCCVSEDSPKDRKESSKLHTQYAGERHRDDNVEVKRKIIFAVPRAVKVLGWTAPDKSKSEKVEEGGDEEPKSN